LKALTTTPGNEAVFVSAGTYTPADTLQLKAGTALVCLGPSHSTIIYRPLGGSPPVAVAGNVAAMIDGCTVAESGTMVLNPLINDALGATTINNTHVECRLNDTDAGIALQNNSTVMSSIMSYCSVNASPGYGIRITGGNALISSNTFTANIGAIHVSGGAPTINGNTISYNTFNGITISGGNPTVSNNDISNNTTGIALVVGAGSPAPTITGNAIHHNTQYGLQLLNGTPAISNNSIYCNTGGADLYNGLGAPLDATNNAWDHDPPTTQVPSCFGIDICLGSPVTSVPNNPVVPGSCPL
jgi:parallel beta-helix repeat protein